MCFGINTLYSITAIYHKKSLLSQEISLKETSTLHNQFKVVMGILQLITYHKDLFFSTLKATIDYSNQ